MTTAESDKSEAHRRNAEFLQLVESKWPEWEREGIDPDEESILDAAAVGLIEEVWRNSPLEDVQAGACPRSGPPSVSHVIPEEAGRVIPEEAAGVKWE